MLAAGAGERLGGGKLAMAWRDRPLIEGALAAAFAAPVRSLFVVFGADRQVPALARAVAEQRGASDRLVLVEAVDHAEGMAASLRSGLRALPEDADGAFVFLGDMPGVPHSIAPLMASELTVDALAVAPTCGRRRGHPVLFKAALFEALSALSGDQGARAILDGLGERLALVATDDPGVLFDVDTPADLRS